MHKLITITVYPAYQKKTGSIKLEAVKNCDGDRADIYLDIGELSIEDLERMKQQIDQTLIELKN